MARIRLPVVTGERGFQAAAPTFVEVPGSYQPLIPGKVGAGGIMAGVSPGDPALNGVTVLVDVPDEDVSANGLDGAKCKSRYPGHWLVTNKVIPGT